jgi:hypothetical protein
VNFTLELPAARERGGLTPRASCAGTNSVIGYRLTTAATATTTTV